MLTLNVYVMNTNDDLGGLTLDHAGSDGLKLVGRRQPQASLMLESGENGGHYAVIRLKRKRGGPQKIKKVPIEGHVSVVGVGDCILTSATSKDSMKITLPNGKAKSVPWYQIRNFHPVFDLKEGQVVHINGEQGIYHVISVGSSHNIVLDGGRIKVEGKLEPVERCVSWNELREFNDLVPGK